MADLRHLSSAPEQLLCAYWVIDPPKPNLRDEQLLGLTYSTRAKISQVFSPRFRVSFAPMPLFTGDLREWTPCASSRGNSCSLRIALHESVRSLVMVSRASTAFPISRSEKGRAGNSSLYPRYTGVYRGVTPSLLHVNRVN
jgi:hypothetical protein